MYNSWIIWINNNQVQLTENGLTGPGPADVPPRTTPATWKWLRQVGGSVTSLSLSTEVVTALERRQWWETVTSVTWWVPLMVRSVPWAASVPPGWAAPTGRRGLTSTARNEEITRNTRLLSQRPRRRFVTGNRELSAVQSQVGIYIICMYNIRKWKKLFTHNSL